MEQIPLHDVHEQAGARFAETAGLELPRNYGDPAAEYEAVRSAVGIVDRADRAPVRASGRDPVKMIEGLVTNGVENAPEGQGRYAALLTPKGKMVADLRVFRRAGGDELLLDTDRRALDGLLGHMKQFVPPLFARFEDRSAEMGVVGAYGPEARGAVEETLGVELDEAAPEDAFVTAAPDGAEVLVARTRYTGGDGYDIFAPADRLERLWAALVEAGARPVGHGALETLRIEAGRPRWGAELDEGVIPLEAGLKERAISTDKGCYTGQEVIIRILHRGHVNWHLRGFLLDDLPAPAKDASLVRPDAEKTVARITSACTSPRLGQTIALGYGRRELEPPETLRLGSPDGPDVVVVDLPFSTAGETNTVFV